MLLRDGVLTICLCVTLVVSYTTANTTVTANGQMSEGTTANVAVSDTTIVSPQPTTIATNTPSPTTTPAAATSETAVGPSQSPGPQGSSAAPKSTSAPSPTSPSNSGGTNSTPASAVQTESTAATSPTPSPTTTTTTPTTSVNYCLNVSCQHNGTCINGADNFTCSCDGNWTGSTCNQDVHNCDSNPCHNNGNCTDTGDNTYNCSCTPEWLGSTCNININDQCSSSPCGEYGFCENLYGNYNCVCDDGTQGLSCTKPNLCKLIKCGANETCQQSGRVATCGCREGFHYRTPDKCEEILLFSPGNIVANTSNHGPYPALGGFPYFGKRYTAFYVNRNGYITLDRKWDLPYPIVNKIKWPEDIKMVAPLWWQWEVPETGASFHIDSQHRFSANSDVEILDEIERAINNSFVPNFALIATWMYVIPKPASQFAGFQNVTFQCTLTTDGNESYAVFAYRDLNIPSIPVMSGYSNASNLFYTINHEKWTRKVSPLFDASDVPKNNNNYVCLKTLSKVPRPDRQWSLNNTCPCVVDQARFDPRFRFITADNCAVERFGSAPAQCCYDSTYGNLLVDTESAGYPRYKNTTVSTLVQTTHEACCGSNSSLCKYFHKKIPSDNCTSYTKLKTLRLWGNPVSSTDPPFIFNGIGEYHLAGDGFQFIQGRYQEFSQNITHLTAFVLQYSDHKYEAIMDGSSVNYYQDGDSINNGTKTDEFALDGNTLIFKDGFSVEVQVHEQLLLNMHYPDSLNYFFEEGLISVINASAVNISKLESVKITKESDSKFNYSLSDVGNFSTISAWTIEPPYFTNFSEYIATLFIQSPKDKDAANSSCGKDIACLLAYTHNPNQTQLLSEKQALLLEPDALALSLPAFKKIESSWQLYLSEGEYTQQIVPEPNVTLTMYSFHALAMYNSTTGDFSVNLTTINQDTRFTFVQGSNRVNRSDSPALLVCSCTNSSTCDYWIPQYQESLSTGKYFEAVCQCPAGFAGVNCESKMEGWDRCYPGAKCNTNDSSNTCPDGMEGDGFTCYEVNDCLGSPCGENAVCKDEEGYYSCSCFTGYQNISNQCVDINECTSKSDPCIGFVDEFRQYCQNLPGSCRVTCQPRFKGDNCTQKLEYVYGGEISFADVPGNGQTWTDGLLYGSSNEFKTLSEKVIIVLKAVLKKSFPLAEMIVEVTSFYRETRQRRATDLTDNIAASYEVFMDHPASPEKLRTALDAGFDTSCPQNTSCTMGNGTNVLFGVNRLKSSLSDIVNMCESDDTNNCHKGSTTCIHGNGTFTCQCRPGFTEWFQQDNVCKDIDECANKTAACGDTAITCVNEPGSYSCICQSGYAWTQDNKCVLTDHCRSGPCLNKASCVNTPGEEPGFACKCPYGYTGSTCKDKDAEVEKNKTIIIAVSASLGSLCFLLLVALCCVCSRQKKGDKEGRQAHYRLEEEEELPALRTRIPRPQVRKEPDLEMVENLGSKTNLYMPIEEELVLKERQEAFNKHTKFDKHPNPEDESHHYTNLAYNGTTSGELNERL